MRSVHDIRYIVFEYDLARREHGTRRRRTGARAAAATDEYVYTVVVQVHVPLAQRLHALGTTDAGRTIDAGTVAT